MLDRRIKKKLRKKAKEYKTIRRDRVKDDYLENKFVLRNIPMSAPRDRFFDGIFLTFYIY